MPISTFWIQGRGESQPGLDIEGEFLRLTQRVQTLIQRNTPLTWRLENIARTWVKDMSSGLTALVSHWTGKAAYGPCDSKLRVSPLHEVESIFFFSNSRRMVFSHEPYSKMPGRKVPYDGDFPMPLIKASNFLYIYWSIFPMHQATNSSKMETSNSTD